MGQMEQQMEKNNSYTDDSQISLHSFFIFLCIKMLPNIITTHNITNSPKKHANRKSLINPLPQFLPVREHGIRCQRGHNPAAARSTRALYSRCKEYNSYWLRRPSRTRSLDVMFSSTTCGSTGKWGSEGSRRRSRLWVISAMPLSVVGMARSCGLSPSWSSMRSRLLLCPSGLFPWAPAMISPGSWAGVMSVPSSCRISSRT